MSENTNVNDINSPEEVITAEPTIVKEAPVVENAPVTNENRESRREVRQREKQEKIDWEKRYKDSQSFHDKRYTESQTTLKRMEQELSVFSPYKDALLKAMEEKKRAELAQLYQTNPIEAQRRQAEELMNQRFGPIQEKIQEYENEKVLNQSINELVQAHGQEAFEFFRGPMAQVLQNAASNPKYGPQAAEFLARNPELLFNATAGFYALQQMNQKGQVQQQGLQSKAQKAQVAAGSAKPGTSNRNINTNTQKTWKQIEDEYYDQVKKQYGLN